MRLRTVAFAQQVDAMQADVVRAPLHVGGGERYVERRAERGDVLEVDLFLEVLGASGDEYPLAAEDGRYEIGERLPGARARLGQQDTAVLEHVRHAGGHLGLARARFVVRQRLGERAAGTKDLGR